MQLIDTVTVVHYVEPTHHEAGDVSFVFAAHLVSDRIQMPSFSLTLLYVMITLHLQSAFQCFHI